MGYSTDSSKAVVPVLVLLFVALFFTSLGEENANLSAFRTFVRFVLVWFCRIPLPLPLGVWEGLWFVIVAFPGLICCSLLKLCHTAVIAVVNGSRVLFNHKVLKMMRPLKKLALTIKQTNITQDKAVFTTKNLISPRIHMLWVLIRRALAMHF